MATFTPAVKSVCMETRPLVLLLILMNFISDGTCQNISLSCPLLQEGSVTKFNCYVPISMCPHKTVFFQFENKSSTPATLCTTSSSSPCDQQLAGGMACGCVASDSDFRYYQLNLLGDKATYDGGNLSCRANCIPIPNAAVCQPLSFASNGGSMHILRSGIVASMSGIIAFISAHLN